MRHLASILRFAPFLVLLLATSCGDPEPSDGSGATIRFWHFWSEPGQRAALESIVHDFEKQTGITVELTELSWNDGKAKLQAAFNSGSAPDVLELGSDWVAQFSSAGVLMQLPMDSAAIGRFVPYTLEPGMWDQMVYAYPWTVDTRVMYVNRDLLDKAGWKGPVTTMDQLLEASEMVLGNGAYGYGANGADGHRLYKKILPFMWTYGLQGPRAGGNWQGAVVSPDGHAVLNSDANRRAFEMYAALSRTGYIETQRQLDAAFLQGKIAFWNSGSWLLPRIADATNLRVEAILMPGIDGEPGVSFAGGEYLAVSKSTTNTQRAREFVQFLTSAERALAFCESIPEAGFPADKATYQAASLVKDPMKAVFAQQLEHARMTPVHPRWLDLEAIVEDAVVRVLLGDESVEDALTNAQDEAEIVTREK